jgi:hypothetical protein
MMGCNWNDGDPKFEDFINTNREKLGDLGRIIAEAWRETGHGGAVHGDR